MTRSAATSQSRIFPAAWIGMYCSSFCHTMAVSFNSPPPSKSLCCSAYAKQGRIAPCDTDLSKISDQVAGRLKKKNWKWAQGRDAAPCIPGFLPDLERWCHRIGILPAPSRRRHRTAYLSTSPLLLLHHLGSSRAKPHC